jgi:uncharacterized RDD family membrane protein YckC
MTTRLNSASMYLCNRLLMIVALACLLSTRAMGAESIVAHASDDTLWLTQALGSADAKPPNARTMMRFRALNKADQAWRELTTPLGATRIVQIANRGDTAAALLDSGEWMLLWPPDEHSTGPSLPQQAKMLALANDRDTLYAISAATTQPTTSTATTNVAATEPGIGTDQPILYTFEGADWKALANCPEIISASPGDISLAIVDRHPMLAAPNADGAIQIYQFDDAHKWIDAGTIKPPADAKKTFKLLSGTQRPMLWIAQPNTGGLLYIGGDRWQEPVKLDLSHPVSITSDNLVWAAGAIRLFLADDKGKLFEQRYDNNGSRSGDLVPLDAPVSLEEPYENWPMLVFLGAMLFLMLTSARRGSAETDAEADPDELIIASAGQRFLAGLIDAIPLVAGALYVGAGPNAFADPNNPLWLVPMIFAILAYLLHTTVSELVSRRTLGKIIVGLQVVSADGNRATAGAILIRNLLRVIDIFPVPLGFLILFSPLHQRLGDLLSGTIVIVTRRAPHPDDEEKE